MNLLGCIGVCWGLPRRGITFRSLQEIVNKSVDELRAEALSFLGVAEESTQPEMDEYYPKALAAFINKGIELEMLDPKLKEYDLAKLGAAIEAERDYKFTYLGLQTLYSQYSLGSRL